LERRFPWIHKISKYTSEELSAICFKKIKDIEWETSLDEADMVKIIDTNIANFKNAGGDIENMITKAKMVHAKRIFALESYHKFILTKEDFENAIKFIKLTQPKEEEDTTTPFDMYS